MLQGFRVSGTPGNGKQLREATSYETVESLETWFRSHSAVRFEFHYCTICLCLALARAMDKAMLKSTSHGSTPAFDASAKKWKVYAVPNHFR